MTSERKKKVFLCGPFYSPEEFFSMGRLAEFLTDRGFDVFLSGRDGIEARLLELSDCGYDDDAGGHRFSDICTGASRAIFAIDIFRIVDCDFLLFNMNGRVPDEGGLFRAAFAYATGTPLVLYKEDYRTAFHGGDNSMISGLSHSFSTVNRFEKIPAALEAAGRSVQGGGDRAVAGDMPPLVRETVRLGKELSEFLVESRFNDAPVEELPDLFAQIKMKCDESRLFDPPGKPGTKNKLPETDGGKAARVYCSGALFCPEETGAMGEIAQLLEADGLETFLPHRDGMEAFVMNQVNSAFANAWVFTPIRTLMNKAIFALDIYQITEQCDAFVFNMNGRTPDEGGVVETAVAFAMGKPVVVYKNDRRSFFYGCDNPMLRGVMDIFSTVGNPKEIHGALANAAQKVKAAGGKTQSPDQLPVRVGKSLKFGQTVWSILGKIQFLKPKLKF